MWDPNWLYLHKENTAPLLIGEWGGFMDGGRNEKWMTAIRDLIVDRRLQPHVLGAQPELRATPAAC